MGHLVNHAQVTNRRNLSSAISLLICFHPQADRRDQEQQTHRRKRNEDVVAGAGHPTAKLV